MSKRVSFEFSRASLQRAKAQLIQYKSLLDDSAETVLLALLDYGREQVIQEISNLGAVYTGELVNSIQTEIVGKVGYIFTDLDYAKFVEYGTGVVADSEPTKHPKLPSDWVHDSNAHGLEGWLYYNENDGQFHRTIGMKHRPFMYNAYKTINQNKKQIAREVLRK